MEALHFGRVVHRRRDRLGAVERLNLAVLVHPHHDSLDRQIQVQADNVAHLVNEKLLSLSSKTAPLRPGVTRRALQQLASQMFDNQAAQQLNTARTLLFQSIHRRSNHTA
jgi:hypothetical protein